MKMILFVTTLLCSACSSLSTAPSDAVGTTVDVVMESSMLASGGSVSTTYGAPAFFDAEWDGWVEFEVELLHSGIYRIDLVEVLTGGSTRENPTTLWIEGGLQGEGQRRYAVTGPFMIHSPIGVSGRARTLPTFGRNGPVIDKGNHRMRLHFSHSEIVLKAIRFTLLRTPSRPWYYEPPRSHARASSDSANGKWRTSAPTK